MPNFIDLKDLNKDQIIDLISLSLKWKNNNCAQFMKDKNVVLIDDVLFTGRSIKAAMSSMDSYGRPNSIELLVLIDRRYKREIPIQANYCGAKIDTFKGDRVNVVWNENSDKNVIYIEN